MSKGVVGSVGDSSYPATLSEHSGGKQVRVPHMLTSQLPNRGVSPHIHARG
jgi:hypothetical protein